MHHGHDIKTTEKIYPLDITVFVSGFGAMTGSLLKSIIEGRKVLKLKDACYAGPCNYLGSPVPGFPNMFTVTGPGCPSVLCNVPPAIEHHVDWITKYIAPMQAQGVQRIEAYEKAADSWVPEVNEAANATLLPIATHSCYVGANVPGKPRVPLPYAGGFAKYRKIVEERTQAGYQGFSLST